MPGIYINDGGQTSSALSSALAGLAGAMSPENAAKAQLYWLESEKADLENQQLSNRVAAERQSAGSFPSLLSGANANPPGGPNGPNGVGPTVGNVTDSGSSVASSVANMTQQSPNQSMNQGGSSASGAATAAVNAPRGNGPFVAKGPYGNLGPRDTIDTSGMTPFAKWAVSEYLNGRMGSDQLRSAITLGQQMVGGPGNTYETQEAVSRARQMPITRTVGQETILNPAAAAQGPGGVVPGLSPVQVELDKATGQEAALAIAQKPQAITNLSELQKITELYDQVVTGDPAQIIPDEVLKSLSEKFGVDLRRLTGSTYADVQKEIALRLRTMVTTVKDAQADNAVRGVYQNMLQNLPDPAAGPGAFHRMVAHFQRQLQLQVDDGTAAEKFGESPGDHNDVVNFRKARDANHTQAATDLSKIKETVGEGGPAPDQAGGDIPILDDPSQVKTLPRGVTRFRVRDPSAPGGFRIFKVPGT
jgi:hypothetical protein